MTRHGSQLLRAGEGGDLRFQVGDFLTEGGYFDFKLQEPFMVGGLRGSAG